MTNLYITKSCEIYENGKWKIGSGHFVVINITEWLDESEPEERTFSLEEMLDAVRCGNDLGYASLTAPENNKLIQQYFKNKFGIDINTLYT